MINLQINSDVSGIWDVDSIPIGWRATPTDYDGTEDDRVLIGKTLDDLMREVKEWDLEYGGE